MKKNQNEFVKGTRVRLVGFKRMAYVRSIHWNQFNRVYEYRLTKPLRGYETWSEDELEKI
jgi:hypothetical protein